MERSPVVKRDRRSSQSPRAVTVSSSTDPMRSFSSGTGVFFDGFLRAQRTEAMLALQRSGGNEAACSTVPSLRCSARANYSHTKSIQVAKPVKTGDGGWEATATLVAGSRPIRRSPFLRFLRVCPSALGRR